MHRAKKTKQANQLKRRFYVKITKYGYVLYNSAFFRASLVPYRQCSAARPYARRQMLVRGSADTAICAKPLAR
jgi:hypothetical protein